MKIYTWTTEHSVYMVFATSAKDAREKMRKVYVKNNLLEDMIRFRPKVRRVPNIMCIRSISTVVYNEKNKRDVW